MTAPTLLIVGGHDQPVIDLSATHLFEEPGTLEAVENLAADWFVRYLKAA